MGMEDGMHAVPSQFWRTHLQHYAVPSQFWRNSPSALCRRSPDPAVPSQFSGLQRPDPAVPSQFFRIAALHPHTCSVPEQ
eukprot:gene23533-biopygen1268